MRPKIETIFEEESGRREIIPSNDPALEKRIRELVTNQSFCVLCTAGQRQPYGSLIAFAFEDDLKSFYFVTPRETRKFELLTENVQISILIDDRTRHINSPNKMSAVTITGRAEQVASYERYIAGIKLLKDRHPYLINFIDSTQPALFKINVIRFFYVEKFQTVKQWIP